MIPGASGIPQISEEEREHLKQLVRALRERAGLDYSGDRITLFAFTLRHRLHRLNIPTVQEYIQYLQHHEEEWQALINAVSVLETSFFRQREYFQAIVHHVLPTLHRTYPADKPIQIWSVATATGEEAYTLAMAAWESGIAPQRPVVVWATDINTDALAIARKARYTESRIRRLPEPWVKKYLIHNPDGTYTPREEIRRLVRFRAYNLLTLLSGSVPFPPLRMDIIYCTNVLIYFNRHTTQELIRALADLLSPQGVLFIDRAITYLTGGILQRVRWQNAIAFRPLAAATPHRRPRPVATRTDPHRSPQRASRPHRKPHHTAKADPATSSTSAPSFTYIQHLVNANRLLEAEQALQQWLNEHPSDYRAHFLMGRLYQMRDNIDKARYHYKRALILHPTLSAAYLELANLHRREGEMHRARREYRLAADTAEKDTVSVDFGFSPRLIRRLALKALSDLKPPPART